MQVDRREFTKTMTRGALVAGAATCLNEVLGHVSRASETDNKRGNQRLTIKALNQWEMLRYGMFIHFGTPTYTGYPPAHYRPPKYGQDPPSVYAPDKLNVDQWVSVARDAGMKYAVLTAKFNDGFCLWPSKLSDYNVSKSGNTTDVVEAFVKSCEKRGIKAGLYYNSNDAHMRLGSKIRSDVARESGTSGVEGPTQHLLRRPYTTSVYQTFMTNHIVELLTQYGPLTEFWIDLPGELGRGYRTFLYNHIAGIQPDIIIVMNHGRPYNSAPLPASMDVEYSWPSDVLEIEMMSLGGQPYSSGITLESGVRKWWNIEGNEYYLPAELSGPIRADTNWFYGPKSNPAPVSDDKLLMRHEICRDSGINWLLDVPPDQHGLIPDCYIQSLMRLRKNARI